MTAVHSLEDMRRASQAREQEEAARLAEAGKLLDDGGAGGPGSGGGGVDDETLDACLDRHQRGEGELYARLHQGKYALNRHAGDWLAWAGHHWERDVLGASSNAVQDVADLYLARQRSLTEQARQARGDGGTDLAKRLDGQAKRYMGAVRRLQSVAGVASTLEFAGFIQGGLGVGGEVFDSDPWLFGCANGVLDLRTGELRDGRPEDWILHHSPVAWAGIDAPCPAWEAFVVEVLGCPLVAAFVQRLLGYSMTGLTVEHHLPVLYGSGRNGKSTLLDVVGQVLGDYAWTINVEMLLDQRGAGKSSAGPSPDIMSLRGRRQVVAAEPPPGSAWNLGKVKQLTGGDKLCGRSPHDKYEVVFSPSHTLILCSNEKPRAQGGGDFAFWQRLLLIPFQMAYVDEPDPARPNERRKNPHLKTQLREELPGILAWLARGCLDWQRQGLHPPAAILEATQRYQRDEDLLEDWIEDCCERDPAATAGATKLYQSFAEWYEGHVGKKVPSQKAFGDLMGKKGFTRIKGLGGRTYYAGLREPLLTRE